MKYIQLFEIPILRIFMFCFVRIPCWLGRNLQRVYLFSHQFWKPGTVCEQGEANIHKIRNSQAFILWSKVWSGLQNFSS